MPLALSCTLLVGLLALAMAAAIAGLVLHSDRAAMWPGALAATATVIALLVVAGVARGERERRRIERALVEAETKFEVAFKCCPHPMLITRREDGRVLAANDAFKAEYGLSDAEFGRRTTLDLGFWMSPRARDHMLAELARTGRLSNYLLESQPPNGRRKRTLLSAEAIVLGGEPCILTVGSDITELIEAEETLAQTAAELGAIFENSAVGITLLDADGRVVRCNPALERFVGYTADELRRMTFVQITHPSDRERDATAYGQLVVGTKQSYRVEKRYVRKDGTEVWGRVTASVGCGPEGQFRYGIAVIEDITEAKRTELALQESERALHRAQAQLIESQKLEALGQLAGGVAHDFNNILAAIMLYLDLFKFDPGLPQEMQDHVREMTRVTRRAAGLTRQLLLFSRREPAQRETIDLNLTVANLQKMLGRLLGEHFRLEVFLAAEPLWLHADPGMIEQVAMNLVVNARDAMERGGSIAIELGRVAVDREHASAQPGAREGQFACLAVVDRGSGMTPEVRARIFEPFFTTKQAGRGTGLGLSTAFGIVQQHAGWIEVETAPGQGSTFRVFLPIYAEPRPYQETVEALQKAERGNETILLAEDNEQVRRTVARILRGKGYRVVEAHNGVAAKEMLDAGTTPIDLLLTDVVMPGGLFGPDVVANLASDTRPPRVIFMSGYTAHADQAAIAAMQGVYLSKPFDAERLLAVVRSTLDGPVVQR